MVVLAHFSTPSQTELNGKITENKKNKIPEYAENYKKEYLFLRGINGEFKYLINKLDTLNEGLFESKTAVRIKKFMKEFLRGQEKGILKDNSGLILPSFVIDNLVFINQQFDLYKLRYDAFCEDDFVYGGGSYDDSDDDSDDGGNGEYLVDGKPYPGFIEFYDLFKKIYSQIKSEDSDYDSDDVSDSDDFEIILPDSDYDSDGDSDSDDFETITLSGILSEESDDSD